MTCASAIYVHLPCHDRGRQTDARSIARHSRQDAEHHRRCGLLLARIATTFGLPSVSVPVLSTTSVSTRSMRSSASACGSAHRPARRADANHDRHRVARPRAQGQAMIQHSDGRPSPYVKRGSGPNAVPSRECKHCNPITLHEPARDLVGRRWIGARERCAAPPSARFGASMCRARPSRAHPKCPIWFSVPPMTAPVSCGGHRLALLHRLVQRGAPSTSTPSTAPSRLVAPAAGRRQRHARVQSPRRSHPPNPPRRFRREVIERADRTRSLLASRNSSTCRAAPTR